MTSLTDSVSGGKGCGPLCQSHLGDLLNVQGPGHPLTPDLRVRSSVDGASRDSDFTQQVDKQ